MTEYMILSGAGESRAKPTLPEEFIRPLLRPADVVTRIDYPASIGPVNPTPGTVGPGLSRSRKVGAEALAKAVARTNNIPVIVAYSLGAYAASDYLEQLAAGRYPDHEVAGAILLASPRASVLRGREGLARAHGKYPRNVPVSEIRNWWDLIASTPSDSPLMKVTGIVDLLTGGAADGFDVGKWIMTELLRVGRLPTVEDYQLVMGYATGPEHTARYLSDPQYRAQAAQFLRHLGV